MAHLSEKPGRKRIGSPLLGRIESLPVLLFILLFAILFGAGPELRSSRYVYEPPWLLLTLNTVFITGLGLLIAALCFRSFLRGGFLNVLLLGCGVLAFGLTSFTAGWLILSPHRLNEAVTVHNAGVLCAAVLLFLSSLFTAVGYSMAFERRRLLIATAAYAGVLAVGTVLTAETVLHSIPPFFVPGEGPTSIRQVVLAVSVTLLAAAALLMKTVYAEKRTGFLLYSVNALMLIGAGLVGIAAGVPGSPLNWLGRTAQYLGYVYLVAASISALGEVRSRGTTVERELAAFFRRSETHYRTLIEMAADPILAIDEEGTVILMNPAAEEAFGYRRDEAAGRRVAEMIVPESSRSLFEECLARESCRDMEMDMAKKGGALFPAELSVSPETRSGERMTRTIIVRDVTRRKQAEEDIRSAALFPVQNPLPVLRIGHDGSLLFANSPAERLLEEWNAKGGRSIPEPLRGCVEAALSDGVARDLEIGAAGRVFSFTVTPISGKQYVNLYGRDVTESKRAEKELQEAKELLERRVRERTAELLAAVQYARSLIEASLDPLVTIRRDGRITDVNRATEQVTGVSRDRLIGTDFSDYFTEPEAARTGYRKAFIDSQVRDYPLTIRHASGRTTEVMYHASVYRNSAGEVLGIFAAARDITEIRKAEAALREINESLERRVSERTEALRQARDYAETLIRTANVLIVGLDAAGNVHTFNDHAEQVTGYARAEILGRNWFELVVPRDRYPHVWEAFGRLQQGALPEELENPIVTKDGTERIISWRNSEIRHAGTLRGTISFGRDITERRQAEESLRAYHELLQIAQRAANAGIWSWEIPSETLTWSEEFRVLFGLEPEAPAAFDTWLAALQPDDRQPAMERIERSIRDGTALESEYRIIRPDGRVRWIRARGSTVYDGIGRPLSMSGICIDVTDSKRAEESLRRSEARYRSYIDVTGQMGWSTNGSGEVVDDLPSLQQYTGLAHDEMRGWGWSKALHPDDLEITLAVWRRAVEEKQGYETEYRLRRHDGVYRHFLARGVPILNDDGSVREWVGACIDITERRKQEQELRKLNRTLRALSRSNEALMRAEEELGFLEEVCRIVVQDCGYAMVWIGYAEDDDDKTVRPVAHAGVSEGYLESLELSWADRERGWGPTGTAIRTGKPDRCVNMLTDPRFEPWRDEALKRGYASSLALPLKDRGSTFGAITIYSTQPDPFSEEEIELLSEMADDLTYGIASLRLRLENRQALQAMRESEARFRLLSDTAGRLLSTDNPQDIIEQLCRAVMKHLDCHAFFNFMVDESAGRLRLNACAGIPEEEARKLEWLDYGVAVCGCVARDKVRIIAEDIFHTPDARTELVRSYGIQAYCCHPLKARDRLIGTLSFGTKTRSRFTSEEVELMRTVADQVSVAMERMQAQRALRISEEALRLANEQLEQRVHERTVELMLLMEDLEKSRDDLRRLASELVIAEERERKRISVILHDEVAQTLAATKMRLDFLRSMSGGDEYRKAISEAEELIGQSIRQTRALMTDITNPVLYDMGLKAAVEALAEDLKARQGIAFTCIFTGSLKNLGQEIEVMIFQVVKELAQNVVKHSGARNAGIRIGEEENSVRVTVTDDGAGFDAGSVGMAGTEGGFGLFSIRERVKSYGGRIAIESGPGKGARVDVMLPRKARNTKAPGRSNRTARNTQK